MRASRSTRGINGVGRPGSAPNLKILNRWRRFKGGGGGPDEGLALDGAGGLRRAWTAASEPEPGLS